MKKSAIITIIGAILVVIGLVVMLQAFPPGTSTYTGTIPAGGAYYYYFEIPQYSGGQVSGDFSVSSGTVEMFVLNEVQYADYAYDLDPAGHLYSTSGSSGTFTTNLASSGKTYVAFNHGAGSEGSVQTITVHLGVQGGMDYTFLIAGLVVALVGIALVVFGMIMKKKEPVAAPPSTPKATDVTMFDKNKPPQ